MYLEVHFGGSHSGNIGITFPPITPTLGYLSKAFKNINAVIHLAYINGTKYFYSKPDLVLDVAVKGLINVFDLLNPLIAGKPIIH